VCVRATTSPPPFETADSARAEYFDAICDVPGPLPKREGFPALTSTDTATLTSGNFESGAFVVKAEFTWLCAWEKDYLAAHKARHTAEQRLAARMILAWDASQFHQSVVVDPSDAWETNVIVPMEKGDSSGVQADLSSCGGNDTVSTE
jgi:hypothetical protein